MSQPSVLEHMYGIKSNTYSTTSEKFDGILIGLAAMLLIRNLEFVVMDLLTFIFGNKKYRFGYRVLRTWQMLNFSQLHRLISGFDCDIPYSRYRISGRGGFPAPQRRYKVRKDRFSYALFTSVLVGKIVVLGGEVAIIAFVIPVGTVHKSEGGLNFRIRNATLQEESFQRADKCHPMLTSRVLSDSAQLAQCKTKNESPSGTHLAMNWTAMESLRIGEIDLSKTSLRATRGSMEHEEFDCNYSNTEESTTRSLHHRMSSRADSEGNKPSASVFNDYASGELTITGNTEMAATDIFFRGSASTLPIFADSRKFLRLSHVGLLDDNYFTEGQRTLTVNGKLFFYPAWSGPHRLVDSSSIEVCPAAIKEIIRVTGTCHAELLIDILRFSMEAVRSESFPIPSGTNSLETNEKGFIIGTSTRFRVSPEWMMFGAGFVVLLSLLTSRFNWTEAVMARVYRERNGIYCACSPSFLNEEKITEAFLYRKQMEYHWGEEPSAEWEMVSEFDFSSDVILGSDLSEWKPSV